MINTNWHPISYGFGVITVYCSNFWHFAFLSPPPLGGLGTMHNVHLGLIRKQVVDFLLVLTELFSPDVTAVSLWAKRDRKSARETHSTIMLRNVDTVDSSHHHQTPILQTTVQNSSLMFSMNINKVIRSEIFMSVTKIVGREPHMFDGCPPAVLCPLSVNICFTWREISIISGGIWVKLGTNIHYMSGHSWKGLQSQIIIQ